MTGHLKGATDDRWLFLERASDTESVTLQSCTAVYHDYPDPVSWQFQIENVFQSWNSVDCRYFSFTKLLEAVEYWRGFSAWWLYTVEFPNTNTGERIFHRYPARMHLPHSNVTVFVWYTILRSSMARYCLRLRKGRIQVRLWTHRNISHFALVCNHCNLGKRSAKVVVVIECPQN